MKPYPLTLSNHLIFPLAITPPLAKGRRHEKENDTRRPSDYFDFTRRPCLNSGSSIKTCYTPVKRKFYPVSGIMPLMDVCLGRVGRAATTPPVSAARAERTECDHRL